MGTQTQCGQMDPTWDTQTQHRHTDTAWEHEHTMAPTDPHKTHGPPTCFQSRRWKWTDSSALDFTSWAPGQPNNLWDKEDCAVLYHLSGEPQGQGDMGAHRDMGHEGCVVTMGELGCWC